MKMRITSSSHSGLLEWLLQRLSAVYLGIFAIYVTARIWLWPMTDFLAWQEWVTTPWVRVMWFLAFGGLLTHAWIGMRSVFMDYLGSFQVRLVASILLASGLLACGMWVIDILYGRGG